MDELKPTTQHRVYDLVREAGLDVRDWANYRRPKSPASNPKYCYNWAFEGTDRVVLCLWYNDMKRDGAGAFQELNYTPAAVEQWASSPPQRKRAEEMDQAIQLARDRRMPIRVIVVDGGISKNAAAHVERRLLDPMPWFVESYADDGKCRLRRGEPEDDAPCRERRLTRIAYNSTGWQRPTGEAGEQEAANTYNAQNRFGHEDWLFRAEWVIDGWRYAFIQGLNKNRKAYMGTPLDVTLFSIQPDKSCRLVATIYELETLSNEQAKEALNTFRAKGWLKTMQNEVKAIGGESKALGNSKWAEHVHNVRYRLANVDAYPPDTFLPNDQWIKNRHRYQLYEFKGIEQRRIEGSIAGRRGRQDAPKARRLFRRGTKPVEYTPEHDKMQRKLMAELQKEYGAKHVWREQDFVDVRVETKKELIYFEIKSDLEPRAVIRQALGQILEYAYHPARTHRRPDRLVIVGRAALGPKDKTYLKHLCEEFSLPLSYRALPI